MSGRCCQVYGPSIPPRLPDHLRFEAVVETLRKAWLEVTSEGFEIRVLSEREADEGEG